MASTWEPTLRLELMTTGENENTWGAIANANLERLAQSVAGYESLSIAGSGDYTITDGDAVGADTRNAFLALTGLLTGDRTVIIPARSKSYVIRRATTGNYTVTIKTTLGTGVRLGPDSTTSVFCDGTNTYAIGTGSVIVIQDYEVSTTTSAYTFTDLSNYKTLRLQYSGLATNVASRITLRGSGNNGSSFTDEGYISFRNFTTTATTNSFDISGGVTPAVTANAAGTIDILFQTQNSANRMAVFGNGLYMTSTGVPAIANLIGTVSICAGSSFAMLLDVDAASGALVSGHLTLTGTLA